MDFDKGLNIEESDSNCVTRESSFTEYGYLNEQGSSDDEGERGWAKEGARFDEELTDLDTDDDLPMSEQDMEDSLELYSASKQPLRTCVQRELTAYRQQSNEALLQVQGAGLTITEREGRTTPSNDEQEYNTASGGIDEDTELGLELKAEVERRRLRDFGLLNHTSDNHHELGSNIPNEEKCTDYRTSIRQGGRSEKILRGGATNMKPSNDKTRTIVRDLSPTRSEPTAVKSCGEASALNACDGSASLSVSTPRGDDQPASPALTVSLFPGCLPPTIHFPMPYENCKLVAEIRTLCVRANLLIFIDLAADTPLPKEQRALLKWKMSSLTPNIVKSCIARAGFTKCTSKTFINL